MNSWLLWCLLLREGEHNEDTFSVIPILSDELIINAVCFSVVGLRYPGGRNMGACGHQLQGVRGQLRSLQLPVRVRLHPHRHRRRCHDRRIPRLLWLHTREPMYACHGECRFKIQGDSSLLTPCQDGTQEWLAENFLVFFFFLLHLKKANVLQSCSKNGVVVCCQLRLIHSLLGARGLKTNCTNLATMVLIQHTLVYGSELRKKTVFRDRMIQPSVNNAVFGTPVPNCAVESSQCFGSAGWCVLHQWLESVLFLCSAFLVGKSWSVLPLPLKTSCQGQYYWAAEIGFAMVFRYFVNCADSPQSNTFINSPAKLLSWNQEYKTGSALLLSSLLCMKENYLRLREERSAFRHEQRCLTCTDADWTVRLGK